MNLQQVKKYWVESALEFFPEPLRTPNRKQFMVAIGLVESGYNYVAQVPEADALGFWQVQLGTYRDNILNFLEFKNEFNDGWSLIKKIHQATYPSMTSDCVFACYMGAITVYRAPAALPEYNDIEGMAKYWKTYYNTSQGAGSIEDALQLMKQVKDL